MIACAADRQYALPLAVMLRSVVANLDSRRALKVYIVDSGLDPGTRSRISASLPERVTLHWMAPERTGFVGLPLWGRMTIATYDKLTIGRWLPASESRALWLDCDLLALTDLGRLWETVQGRSGVLATQDKFVPTLGARFGVACHQELLQAHQRRTAAIGYQNDPMLRRRVQFTQASRSIKPKDHVTNPARMNNQYRARSI